MTASELLSKDGSWTILGLPPSHHHCQLNNFEWDKVNPKGLRPAIGSFLSGIQEGRSPHLLLTGPPGLGKTHLGIGAYRTSVALSGTRLSIWLNVPEFCSAVKAQYGQSVQTEPFQEVEEAAQLVVLDDLLGRDYTSHEMEHILYRLIDTAYMNGAAILVTMNHSMDDLGSRFRPHEISRLLFQATHVSIQGEDWRLR